MHRLWLTVLVLSILGVAPGRGSELFGVALSEIVFEPPLGPGPAASAERALSVRAGEPLDRNDLRESIQALFRTGRFEDIRADVSRVPGGARLTFLVEPAWFIGDVRVSRVRRPPSEGQLLNAAQLQLGELFTEQKLAAGMRSLRALLVEHGFREPRVGHTLEHDPSTQQVHVTLTVESGSRARIGALLVAGERLPLTEREIR